MKTTLTVGPSFLALLVALAPACTLTVDDSPEDEEEDSGVGATTSRDDDEDAGGGGDESETSEVPEGNDGGATTGATTSAQLTVEVNTDGDGGVVGADAGDGAAPAAGDLRQGCGEAEITADATIVRNSVDAPTTWSGVVVIENAVDVHEGADITIAPGTHIIMGNDADLEFGWNSGALTLDAQGTEAAPIIVCGKRAEKGYWRTLTVGGNVLSESVLSNVRIFDGGGGADAALILNASIVVDQVLVSGSESAGVSAVDFEEESSGLSVTNSGQSVILRDPSAVTHFPLFGEFADNDELLARVRFTDTEVDTVFFELGIPYLQERSIDVRDGATVSFEAGVEYQFTADTDLEVGWNSGAVTINVNGTEDAPVVFRGETEQSGFWGGLVIRPNVRTASKLSYLQIRNGGGEGRFAFEVESAIVLDHVELIDNELGMRINDRGLDEDSTTLTIVGTEDYPLTIDPEAIISLPKGGDFTGNETDQIRVVQGDFNGSGTVPNLGVPYRIQGQFETMEGSELTIEPGTHFAMAADSEMEFGWNSNTVVVNAVGTEAEPIVFTGVVEEPGSWRGIVVGPNVNSSAFVYVEFSHAGRAGSVLSLRNEVQVENCTFSDYEGFAILKTDLDLSDYETDNTFSGNTIGPL